MLVEGVERAWQALGKVRYRPTEAERKSLVFRCSIYAAADIAKEEILTQANIRIMRPGYGRPRLSIGSFSDIQHANHISEAIPYPLRIY